MESKIRYIIWQKEEKKHGEDSLRTLLEQFPTIKIVKCEGADYAVVYMDVGTAQAICHTLPGLCIEEDVQYHMTSLL
jgi:hypothetical protein